MESKKKELLSWQKKVHLELYILFNVFCFRMCMFVVRCVVFFYKSLVVFEIVMSLFDFTVFILPYYMYLYVNIHNNNTNSIKRKYLSMDEYIYTQISKSIQSYKKGTMWDIFLCVVILNILLDDPAEKILVFFVNIILQCVTIRFRIYQWRKKVSEFNSILKCSAHINACMYLHVNCLFVYFRFISVRSCWLFEVCPERSRTQKMQRMNSFDTFLKIILV